MFNLSMILLSFSLYSLIGIVLVLISFILMIMSWKIKFLSVIYFFDWEFLSLNGETFNFPMLFDFFSITFFSIVFLISSMIMFYSLSYMKEDMYKGRFILILSLFVLSMFLFILSPNLISMILGWDGLGLVSYCLVIHYQNFSSNNSGMITVLSNRVGDCFLIVVICLMMDKFYWSYMFMLENLSMFLIVMMIFTSITKSAQIPFSSWLPSAMSAPTPVSSLVHSSTLVTAGVFLLIRFSSLLFGDKMCLNLIVMLGLLTTLMAGLCANLEMDMKKIIALSTLSQLGIMMSSLVLMSTMLTFFHLIMHALFKAMMFMCSGNFIHLNYNSQDLRSYGKMVIMSPISVTFFCIANLSLCGFPFLCGFFSKDLILETFFMSSNSLMMFCLFIIGSLLTVTYTVRMMFNLMIFSINFKSKIFNLDNDVPLNMSKLMLFLFSITMGHFFCELMINPINIIILPFKLKTMILVLCLLMMFLVVVMKKYFNLLFMSNFFVYYVEFFNSMCFLSFLSKSDLSPFFTYFSNVYGKIYSNGWIENILGLNNFSVMINSINSIEDKFYNKSIKMPFLMSFILIIICFSWMNF